VKEHIIDIRNITAYNGSTCVFRDFSLTVENGCNTVILGPNGSGKTTLMKLLSCELYPVFLESSHVKIFGHERWNVEKLRTRLGIVSHDLQHSYLTGARGINVILSGFYASIDTWRHQQFSSSDLGKAEAVMEMLGIGQLANRQFGTMSTGEQRRFLLGRALVNDPDALLLDEPTSGLDIKASLIYLETMRKLMRSGKTVILVTHHINEIPPEIERVVLIRDGRVAGEGMKKELLTSEVLSDLFDYPLEVVSLNGYYEVFPALKNEDELFEE
jgi:iron complex transport system ATP-binding protein